MNASTIAAQEVQRNEKRPGVVYRNIANVVSILGILPLPLLFVEGGYRFVIPMMIYNNIMDDLDGVAAWKLGIRSEFGRILDNVCDAVAHSVFVMVIAMHHGPVCGALSVLAVLAIELRIVSRLLPGAAAASGSPTNELIRHLLFILLLGSTFEFNVAPFLIAAFVVHTISMLLPQPMPYLLRRMTKSALAITVLNLALVSAWLLPMSTPVIAAGFFVTYLFSLVTGLRLRSKTHHQ
jgi:phosphatidylglycerophosphate synthase